MNGLSVDRLYRRDMKRDRRGPGIWKGSRAAAHVEDTSKLELGRVSEGIIYLVIPSCSDVVWGLIP